MKTALVITSIAAPNEVLFVYAKECRSLNIDFILIGDVPSPKDFKIEGCLFYGIEEQRKLSFRLTKLLPLKHYARKNLGYLLAKENDIIVETDDDNFPYPSFWEERLRFREARTVDVPGWINVYRYFSSENIWPRGFPLENIHMEIPTADKIKSSNCPIQQGLADKHPDVDAVFRLVNKQDLHFLKERPVVLGKNNWCPFNSQNTVWFKEAFPLLYLPSYCSFRMTDIWRSFVAQRIAWTCGWNILFHESTVWQERNEHDLMKDFSDELPGYLNNARICKTLEALTLKEGVENISKNLISCYRSLIELGVISKEELPLVEAWTIDMCN